MGLVSIDVDVSGESGTRAPTKFLVDSGASYSVLPRAVWKRLGLRPKRAMRFELADGTEIRRQLSECRFTFEGIDAVSPVVLGHQKDVALLGTVTLETMGLVLHPLRTAAAPHASPPRRRPLTASGARQFIAAMSRNGAPPSKKLHHQSPEPISLVGPGEMALDARRQCSFSSTT